MIYWFIGQPGSGKTLLADKLKEEVLPHAYRIDGDEMRELFDNKDYSMKGRIANIDAAQKIALYLHNQGKDVIVSLVTPYLDQREEFKDNKWFMYEIYCHYNVSYVQRGRENYHVLDFQKPILDYLDLDTTVDTEEESFNKVKKYIGKEETFNSNRASG